MTTIVAALAAIGLAAFGVVRGTWAVGGSDSSCYGLMAKAFAGGHLQPTSVLALDAPWPDAAVTFAPGGFIPSTLHPDAAAPICAPGMSVLMAPLAAVFGQDAMFWLTPIAAAVLVIAAFVVARRLAGGMAGAAAAILTATSPIVLYQTVQPMNDVVTAALWMAAMAAAVHRRETSASAGPLCGFLIGLAIMVRPNLAPLAVIVAVTAILAVEPPVGGLRRLAMLVVAALPGIATMLWLNDALYGSPFRSGYGAVSGMFSTSHVQANLTNYSRALFQTQNIVPLAALLAPMVLAGARRMIACCLLAGAAVVIGIYLLYLPFPEWWYLRFLMPAIVMLLVLASAAGVQLLSKARMGGLIPIAAVVLGALGVRSAIAHDVLALQALEGRYREASAVVRDRLPPNAVVITEWQSGSVRFHAGREIVAWESLDPAWLDRAVTWLKSKGLKPYVLVERREEPSFRSRFGAASEFGALDWPPRFDIGRQARIYDVDDRARYRAGEPYATEQAGYPRRTQSPRKM
jgi:hypothetical protein